MSYCSLSPFDSKSGDEFKTAIDNVNITCHKGTNSKNVSQTWKTFYIPLSHEVSLRIADTDKASFIDTCDLLVAADGKEYYKMTYKNIQRFATLEQSNAYHAFRKQHLCFVMSEAVKGTEFCYKMMGSNSSASDVDISVFSTALVPKRPSEDIKKIISTYNKLNADRFGKEDMADIFDANLYFTNFLQVFEVLDDDTLDMKFGNVREQIVKYGTNANVNVNVKVTNLKKEILNKMTSKRVGIDVGSVSTGCFGLVSNKKINARALYIPSMNNHMQRVYAMMRLAEYFAFNGALLKSVVESGIALASSSKDTNSSVKDRFMKQLIDVFDKCKEVQHKVDELRVNSDEAYKRLMEDYFIQREYYIMDGLRDQAVANDVINTLSLATFMEDEAYHSQGAFLHINAQKDWGFELNEDDYVDSIFENVGFMMEYSDAKRHVGMSPFGRYEKINKYYSRISDALAMIEKERVPCQGTSSVLSNVKRNTARTNQQDVLRKECSNDNTGEKELVYNKMINKMVTDFTQGIITLENVKQMTFDQLKMVVNSMLRRILFYMMEMRLEPFNFVAQGGASKGLKVVKDKQTSQASQASQALHQTLATPLNAALMIAPLLGGKRARKQKRRMC
jgi:hypothetical protein